MGAHQKFHKMGRTLASYFDCLSVLLRSSGRGHVELGKPELGLGLMQVKFQSLANGCLLVIFLFIACSKSKSSCQLCIFDIPLL